MKPYLLSLLLILPVLLSAVEPSTFQNGAKVYRISLRNSSGQISVPDDTGHKTYFIDLSHVGMDPPQFFGGPDNKRFRAVKFVKLAVPDPRTGERDVSELTCQEVTTKGIFVLVVGKEVKLPQP